MLFPFIDMQVNPLVLLVLGFTVGVLGGFFGVGGGFIVTPAFNILRLSAGHAIGTGLAQVLGTAVVAGLKHRKLGSMDFKLGAVLIVSALPAVELGKSLVEYLTQLGLAGAVVRYVYIILLGGFGLHMLWGYFKAPSSTETQRGLAERNHLFRIPPTISFPTSGIERMSLWVPVVLGLGVGLLSGFIGVGGGFIMVPALVALGIPPVTIAGTSLFTIVMGLGAYGTFSYAMENQVDLGIAVVMLMGSSLGAHVGARATRHARMDKFRILFAGIMLVTAGSVILKQVSSADGWSFLSDCSAWLLLVSSSCISLFITGFLLTDLQRAKAAAAFKTMGRATSSVWALAMRVSQASIFDADPIFRSKEWPQLWQDSDLRPAIENQGP